MCVRRDKTIEQLTVDGHVHQMMQYNYGVGPNAANVIKVENPDAVTGDPSTAANEDETETLDNFGNPLTETSPDGTVHSFFYDALGRLKRDSITTLARRRH